MVSPRSGVASATRRAMVSCVSRGWSGRADNGSVDIVGDYRARLLHEQGMPFREIAERTGTSLTRVRAALRTAAPGRMRREIRAEIRGAGGLSAWWRQ